ncbi:MAG: hypothetical protein KDK59_07605, partial [Simkania sp.]|nr:hypothetical protein [Simkania sp.]
MSGVTLGISNLYGNKILNRQEGESYFKTLEKGSIIYQEIGRVLFQKPFGIYTFQNMKINTFEKGLSGGSFFGSLAKLAAEKNPTLSGKTAKEVWAILLKEPPKNSEEENVKTLADFQTKLSQLSSPQKQNFETFLQEVEGDFENALNTANPDRMKKKLDDLLNYIREENQKYIDLYDALKKATAHRTQPTHTTIFNNTIQGNVTNQGNGIQNFGQMTIQGNVPTGNITVQGHQYNNKSEFIDMAFGKAKWEKFFGDTGIEPPLPLNINEILNSPCPFWSGKKVRETHVLILVPRTVSGNPFCLDTLCELIKNPKSGNATKCHDYD